MQGNKVGKKSMFVFGEGIFPTNFEDCWQWKKGKDGLRKQNRYVWLCSLDENQKLAEMRW